MVTIFKSIADTDTPFYRDIEDVLHRIKVGKSRGIIERVRVEFDKDDRNSVKKELPAICFSGEFSRRDDKSIISHSGFICLDFDGFDDNLQLELKKEELKEDVDKIYKTPDYVRRAKRNYARKRYQEDPEYREKQNKLSYESKKKNIENLKET